MEETLVFIFGLIFGSFGNLLVFRLHTSEPLFMGGSKCLHCQEKLYWFELIPVVSFIVQKGKCRNCGSKLSLQYPIVEIASGFLFLFVWLAALSDFSVLLVLSILFWFSLFLASIYDLKHKILPDEFILIAGLAALLSRLFLAGAKLELNVILAALSAFLFFAFIWLASRGKAMGLGDAKMAGASGLFLGFPKIVPALVFSFWLGAIFGILLLILKRANLKSAVPFGPFLFIGAFLSWILGFNFLETYISLW